VGFDAEGEVLVISEKNAAQLVSYLRGLRHRAIDWE